MIVRIEYLTASMQSGKIDKFLNELEELLVAYAGEKWDYKFIVDVD